MKYEIEAITGLPCKLGDTVFWLSRFKGGVLQGKVAGIKVTRFGLELEIYRDGPQDTKVDRRLLLGAEEVYLTREDAEASLAQSGGTPEEVKG